MKQIKIFYLLLFLILITFGIWIINFFNPDFSGAILGIPFFIINTFIFLGIFCKKYRKLFLIFFILLLIGQGIIWSYENHLKQKANTFGNIETKNNFS
jgi:signal transduction histidine kinase